MKLHESWEWLMWFMLIAVLLACGIAAVLAR